MTSVLNPVTLPLTGTSLIEASAGTGKTYHIAALFSRLVLLDHLPVSHILVVTFTKAATAELKTRLRLRLNEALAVLQNTHRNPPDDVMQALLTQALAQESADKLALRLQAAINEFDGASIYTIHGFCQRVLTDYAFLCHVPFDTETAEADPQLLRTFAEDFWRQHVSNNPQLAPLVAASNLTPQTVATELGFLSNRADVRCRPAATVDLAAQQAALQQAWQTVCANFAGMRATFTRIQPQLNGNVYNAKTFAALWTELAAAVDGNNPRYPFSKADKFAKFATETLQEKSKKGQIIADADLATLAPLAAFGTASDALAAAEKAALLQLQLDCFANMRTRMQQHQQNSHQRGYDDLLADVAAALSARNPQAAELAQTLARDWDIALIDECQDTDPLQYRIFKTAFADQNRPLLMVGDPKQAIYSFRGADIHAYLQAAADTPPGQRHSLSTNYRSHQALVQSIGHVFSGKTRPFVLDGIDYTPVAAHREHSALQPALPALTVRWLHEYVEVNERGKELLPNKEALRQRAADWCADEIAAMINAGTQGCLKYNRASPEQSPQWQPMQAGNIAVLVRTHNEGKMVAKSLKQRGVASVSLGNQSVFISTEAPALAALLRFWLVPQRVENLRYVLGSTLFAWTAEQLFALNQDDSALNHWLQLAQNARDTWQQNGVYAAIQAFASATGLESSLLVRRNERSLTNFWQLAELLADAAQNLPTPAALVQWLAQQISDPGRQHSEDAMLRLESDDALVKIVTMHAAKGLEYPVVFCPFVWDGKDAVTNAWNVIHHGGEPELVHRDLLSEHDQTALREDSMGELLRLYYVAFTRARERLVLYAAAGSSLIDNPFAYLLDGQPDGRLADSRQYWEARKDNAVSTLQAAWRQCLHTAPADTDFDWQSGAPVPCVVAPQNAPSEPYHALILPPRAFDFVRFTSFTALSRHTTAPEADEELNPQIDIAEAASALPHSDNTEPETPLLAFARGMNAGLCLHALLEQTDFTQPAAAQSTVYPPLLRRFGFADTPLNDLLPMIDAVRECHLFSDTTLADIPATHRSVEMDFMLHIADFALPSLQAWLAQPHLGLPENCIQAARQLDFATVNGFVNGAIDVVCEDTQGRVCVLDYKSNYLGNRLTDYHTTAMNQAMAEHHYYLQALIYSIAVARFLQTQNRLPETLSVRYLFLRGLNNHNNNGVWCWDIATADLAPWLGAHDKA